MANLTQDVVATGVTATGGMTAIYGSWVSELTLGIAGLCIAILSFAYQIYHARKMREIARDSRDKE